VIKRDEKVFGDGKKGRIEKTKGACRNRFEGEKKPIRTR
jgi:hypothetical protein